MGSLDGKVALITGAARGQGRAHALKLAGHGADIIAVDVPTEVSTRAYELATKQDLAETAELVEGLNRRIVTVEGDVRSQASLDTAVREGLIAFGRVDICVANAGIWTSAPVWELSEQQWCEMIDINLTGVWRTAKAVIPHLIQAGQGGSIVLISSINGLEAGGRCAHYTAAKHGVIGLMRNLALELAPYGIRCNAVCPGSVDTPMVNWPGAYDQFAGHTGGTREDFVTACRHYHALKGAGPLPAKAIADAVAWLVSDAAAFVTGSTVPVDGGHLVLPGVNRSPIA